MCNEKLILKEDAVFLIHNVLSILLKKASMLENAKVGALLMMEAFTKEGYFGKDIVDNFMSEHLSIFI
jgi:hypothetical protein